MLDKILKEYWELLLVVATVLFWSLFGPFVSMWHSWAKARRGTFALSMELSRRILISEERKTERLRSDTSGKLTVDMKTGDVVNAETETEY